MKFVFCRLSSLLPVILPAMAFADTIAAQDHILPDATYSSTTELRYARNAAASTPSDFDHLGSPGDRGSSLDPSLSSIMILKNQPQPLTSGTLRFEPRYFNPDNTALHASLNSFISYNFEIVSSDPQLTTIKTTVGTADAIRYSYDLNRDAPPSIITSSMYIYGYPTGYYVYQYQPNLITLRMATDMSLLSASGTEIFSFGHINSAGIDSSGFKAAYCAGKTIDESCYESTDSGKETSVFTTLDLNTNELYTVNLALMSSIDYNYYASQPPAFLAMVSGSIDPVFHVLSTSPDISLIFSPGVGNGVVATPELSTWAMLALGFLSLGGLARRRFGDPAIRRPSGRQF